MIKTFLTALVLASTIVSASAGEGIVSKWNKVSSNLEVSLSGKTISEINNKINAEIAYRNDSDDHWQTPAETLTFKTGDCEDYAILKYAVLHKLGYRVNIVVGKLPRNGNIDHAWVEVKDGNDWIILDNRNNVTPKRDDVKAFFTPIFTLSVDGVWIGSLKIR